MVTKKEFQNGHIGLCPFFNFLYSQTEKKRETEREREREMSRIPSLRSLQSLFLLCLISVQFISGFANDSPSTKDENNAGSHGASGSSVGIKIVIVCLGLVAVFAFAVFLFKIWQKKKREEQHARLLKLFEDDDELEVELGIRD